MLKQDTNKYKQAKIDEIISKIGEQPLYKDLFEYLLIKYDQDDFMKAEAICEAIEIGANFVKIVDPNTKILDFFKSKGYNLSTILPALETEKYTYNVTAWMEK